MNGPSNRPMNPADPERLCTLGRCIERDADAIVAKWVRLVEEESRTARPADHGTNHGANHSANHSASHRGPLRDELPEFLRALGRSLRAGQPLGSGRPRLLAERHGWQRWRQDWRIDDVVEDYRRLRRVLFEHLTRALGVEATVPEMLHISRGIDEAVMAAIRAYSDHAEATIRESESRLKALNGQLEQTVAERTAEVELRVKQLRHLAVVLTQAEQRERRRLAEILHDHLQQLLVAAKMRLDHLADHVTDRPSLAEPESVRARLVDVSGLLTETIQASRTLAMELSPPVLHESGLNAGLEWLARWMGEKHRLRVACRITTPAEPAGPELRTAVFHSVRELLFNVVKYAQTGEARLTVEQQSEPQGERHDERRGKQQDGAGAAWYVVTVADRGRGFDPQAIRPDTGLGLFQVRQRLESFGGQVEVISAPQEGTTVRLRIPAPVACRPDGASD
jgi:signal transduction histidine kinase